MDQPQKEYGHLPATWLMPAAFGIIALVAFGFVATALLSPYFGEKPPLTVWGEKPKL